MRTRDMARAVLAAGALLMAAPSLAQMTHDAKGSATAGHDAKGHDMKTRDMGKGAGTVSAADKARMARCTGMSHEAMGRDAECAALMKAHPGMMNHPAGKTM